MGECVRARVCVPPSDPTKAQSLYIHTYDARTHLVGSLVRCVLAAWRVHLHCHYNSHSPSLALALPLPLPLPLPLLHMTPALRTRTPGCPPPTLTSIHPSSAIRRLVCGIRCKCGKAYDDMDARMCHHDDDDDDDDYYYYYY